MHLDNSEYKHRKGNLSNKLINWILVLYKSEWSKYYHCNYHKNRNSYSSLCSSHTHQIHLVQFFFVLTFKMNY